MNPSTVETAHDVFMRRALKEARRALGRTRPNPMVGCVIVRQGEIVATGYHERAGERHAEVAALDALQVPGEECELYVNLEPCSHQNRTPPCVDAVIRAGIRRVFVGTIDPNPRVSGRGIERLRAAGIEVTCGILGEQCQALNAPFFKHITTGLPWISVKYAMSLDGKIATRTGDSAWISGELARHRVHELRNGYDAILVGTRTLLHDNPRLTCRIDGGRDPVRVVVDARLDAPPSANVYQAATAGCETLVFTSTQAPAARKEALRGLGVVVIEHPTNEHGWLDAKAIVEELGRRGLMNVLVEGGGRLIGSLIDQQLVDRVYAFVCPKIIGGDTAPPPVAGLGVASMTDAIMLGSPRIEVLGDDVLITADIPSRVPAVPVADPVT